MKVWGSSLALTGGDFSRSSTHPLPSSFEFSGSYCKHLIAVSSNNVHRYLHGGGGGGNDDDEDDSIYD